MLFEPVLARLREAGTPGLVLSGSREEGALVGDVRPAPRPPGRGVLVGWKLVAELVQVAWKPPLVQASPPNGSVVIRLRLLAAG